MLAGAIRPQDFPIQFENRVRIDESCSLAPAGDVVGGRRDPGLVLRTLSSMPTKPPTVRLNLRCWVSNDVDAEVRSIGEIVFRAVRIDPADGETRQRVTGDCDGRGRTWSAWCPKLPQTYTGRQAEDGTSDAAPSNAVAAAPEKYARDLL